jgi:hypothetical protein
MPLDIKAIQRAEQDSLRQETQARERADEEARKHQGKGAKDQSGENEAIDASASHQASADTHERELDRAFAKAPKAVANWRQATNTAAATSDLMAAERAEDTGTGDTQPRGWKPGSRSDVDVDAAPIILTSGSRDFESEDTDEFNVPDLQSIERASRQDDQFDKRPAAASPNTNNSSRPVRRSPPATSYAFGTRCIDFVRTLLDCLLGCFNAVRRGWGHGLTSIARGIRLTISGNGKTGFAHIAVGIATLTKSLLSALIGIFSTCAVATMEMLSKEPPRRLTRAEIALLRAVFGNSINYDALRLRTVHRSQAANKTWNNTLYVGADIATDSVLLPNLLVQLTVRVWHYQVGCNDLFVRALWERLKHGPSQAWEGDVPRTPFDSLTLQQQAMLIQTAHRLGFFDPQSPDHGVFHLDLAGEGATTDLSGYLRNAVQILRATKARR